MSCFTCPRCGNEVTERFYGPCEDCRVGAPARYEPKMNVVPNFVATKDDLDDFEPDPGAQ
jgi:hypothetical protein